MQIDLYSPQQGHKAITEAWQAVKPGLEAGKKYTLTLREKTRSNEQNEKYHAILSEIAEQAQHLGAKWSAEDWKRFCVAQFCKDEGISAGRIVPSLDGTGIVQLDYQTRKFTVEQAGKFIEWLQAWCANNGVELSQ